MSRRINVSAARFPSRLTARCLCLTMLVALMFAPYARSDSGPAFLVKDINTAPNPILFTNPSGFTAVGNTIYFAAWDELNGQELWKSDTTGSGATLVKDISPGTTGTSFSAFVNVGEVLFFATANQLWKSDGTAAGTQLVKEFAPDQGLFHLTALKETLFFAAGAGGGQLWKSDGTAAGTLMVKDIDISANASSYGYGLLNLNGTLLFGASDRRSGYELWKSDGTVAGTLRVKDINPGAGASNPMSLVNVDGTAFFTAYDGRSTALWKSNGTAFGTVRVKVISVCPTAIGMSLAIVNGSLFFTSFTTAAGCELWKSDGTPGGTVLVKDLIPGTISSLPYMLTSVGDRLFFLAMDGDLVGRLWASDGTADGTSPVTLRLRPWELANLNGTLFFNAQVNDASVSGLWKTDGTDSGTVLVKNVPASRLTVVQRMLFFSASDEKYYMAPWKSDGTTTGTVPIQRPHPGTQGAESAELTDVNRTLYFVAETEEAGDELWKSDGTSAGTAMVKDISPGDLDSYPRYLTNVGGTLFFVAGESGGDLWKSDGTSAGTLLVKDFPFWTLESVSFGVYLSPRLIDLNGVLYFIAFDEITGNRKIWKSDGTAAGTVPLTETNAAFAGTVVDLAAVNGTLFFATSGELWRTDGTMAGTQRVEGFDVLPPACMRFYCSTPPPSPGRLTNINGRLFFSAYDEQTGYELYTSDGTTAGTRLVKDINPGVNDSAPDYLTNKSGTLFFSATDRVSGRELWASDGTAAGTRLVVDLVPGAVSASPTWLADVRGTLFFAASDAVNGNELWRSDGTAAGTTQVVDLATGSSNPAEITLAGDALFFSADDGSTGQELWAIRGGVDAYIEAPAWSGAAPGGAAVIPLRCGNLGLSSATALTLTATLDPALEYLGDTTGTTPGVSGHTVQWRLPAAGFNTRTDFALRVRLPNAPLGASYPVTLTLTAAAETRPIDNITRVDVVIARQLYVPAARR